MIILPKIPHKRVHPDLLNGVTAECCTNPEKETSGKEYEK